MASKPLTADASDVQRRFAYWKRRAIQRPVVVQNHGQDEIVLLSPDEFARLKRRSREVLRASDFTDAELAAVARAQVPKEFRHLDAELKTSRR